MDRLTLLMTDADKATVLAHYTLVDKNSADYAADVKSYPALANEPIYVLNTVTQADIDVLNPILAKPWLVVYGIEAVMADPSKAAAQGGQAKCGSGAGGFDISKLPAGTDLFK